MELTIRGLSKKYIDGPQALSQVDLTIGQGVFGLLGPNGAGKSTLMRILATLQDADSGTVHLGEVDVLRQRREVRRHLGLLPQDFGLYPKVSAEAFLDHLAQLKGLHDRRRRAATVRDLLERTNLWQVRNRKMGTFSGGMRQRFGIAQALIGEPRLIIVDEPTTGLDPEERGRFFNTLGEVGEKQIVILSTHIVDDVSQLCGQLAILNDGEVLLEDTPEGALERVRGKVWSAVVESGDKEAFRQRYSVLRLRRCLGKVIAHVFADECPGEGFAAATADLEDLYFATLQRRQQVAS